MEERAAARILHDVVDETARAGDRTVLIVHVAVDVSVVGGRDHLGGLVVSALTPVLDKRPARRGSGPQAADPDRADGHEVARVILRNSGWGRGY